MEFQALWPYMGDNDHHIHPPEVSLFFFFFFFFLSLSPTKKTIQKRKGKKNPYTHKLSDIE